jgi:hypothetical protein
MIALSQWEFDFTVVELFDVCTASLDGGDLLNFDDLQ